NVSYILPFPDLDESTNKCHRVSAIRAVGPDDFQAEVPSFKEETIRDDIHKQSVMCEGIELSFGGDLTPDQVNAVIEIVKKYKEVLTQNGERIGKSDFV